MQPLKLVTLVSVFLGFCSTTSFGGGHSTHGARAVMSRRFKTGSVYLIKSLHAVPSPPKKRRGGGGSWKGSSGGGGGWKGGGGWSAGGGGGWDMGGGNGWWKTGGGGWNMGGGGAGWKAGGGGGGGGYGGGGRGGGGTGDDLIVIQNPDAAPDPGITVESDGGGGGGGNIDAPMMHAGALPDSPSLEPGQPPRQKHPVTGVSSVTT
ncbi:hypothetical protein MTO96_009096 [Rhipicephalus appendiculatus]